MKTIVFWICAFLTTPGLAASIDYKSGGKTYAGHIEVAGKNAPMVLLIHDWDGLTNYEVKRAQMLKKLGYSVFAVDLFGKGIRPTENKDKKQHTGELYQDRKKMRAILNAALATAKSKGLNTGNAVAMGYCFGGAAVLEYARSGAPLKAFASFHGGLTTPDGQDYKDTKGKVAVYHGTADTAISMEAFAGLAAELEEQDVKHLMTTYGGAPHAFTVFGSDRYHKDADEKSWASFTSLLSEVTKSSSMIRALAGRDTPFISTRYKIE